MSFSFSNLYSNIIIPFFLFSKKKLYPKYHKESIIKSKDPERFTIKTKNFTTVYRER